MYIKRAAVGRKDRQKVGNSENKLEPGRRNGHVCLIISMFSDMWDLNTKLVVWAQNSERLKLELLWEQEELAAGMPAALYLQLEPAYPQRCV